jgi:hypothetical protein
MRAAEAPIIEDPVAPARENATQISDSESTHEQIGFASQSSEPQPPNHLAEAA